MPLALPNAYRSVCRYPLFAAGVEIVTAVPISTVDLLSDGCVAGSDQLTSSETDVHLR